MTLFRSPVKGDIIRHKSTQALSPVAQSWSEDTYRSHKDKYEFVTVTPIEPPKQVVRYINYYEYALQQKNFENVKTNVPLNSYATRERADQAADVYSATLRRIACIRVVLTEGQFDD